MAPKVTWLGRASDKIQADLVPQLTRELKQVFPGSLTVTVYDNFGGYSQDHAKKVVLAVEVCARNSYHTHVIKLGIPEEVANDYDGWRECVLQHNFASRILVSLHKKNLTGGRVAVIYEDAYRFFGSPEEGQGPQSLETVVHWSVIDNKPNTESVERVIRQIYADMYRWFYRSALPTSSTAIRFYKARLKRAMPRWKDPWRVELRRDLLWLLCSHDDPASFDNVLFLDPCDYVAWALRTGRIPQTLVGRSHGDLHGRNVYVGVQRREAEYPAVFDYGEMSGSNVLVWDFVKLETELKVRLLPLLYRDEKAQDVLYGICSEKGVSRSRLKRNDWPTAHLNPCSLRALQLEFAHRFEWILALLTDRIHKLEDPESAGPPGGRNITGYEKLDSALSILIRIRQEAALCLGDGQPQRGKRGLWKDEYYFGLAAYGLCTSKYDYKESEAAFALVSAGVAAANVSMAREDIQSEIAERQKHPVCVKAKRTQSYPSYHVPLACVHRAWKGERTKAKLERAVAILDQASTQFGHAVLLLQEYALLLAESGQHLKALKVLEPLDSLCGVFRDEETLARIGRTCKDFGDHALSRSPVSIEELDGHPAWQWYSTAFKHYKEAFEICGLYYPGVNAATLGYMCGLREESEAIALKVLETCREQDLTTMRRDDRFWLHVTEGEALLLLSKDKEALKFYKQALAVLPEDSRGMAQNAYNQICRLFWALGGGVKPVADLFQSSKFSLLPGPLGNCRPMHGVRGAARKKKRRSSVAKK